jgi:2-phospho-L-lactate guanylyltransferase
MQVNLVIPIKQLEDAKQRLGSLLDSAQRQALFRAMVEDVLEVGTTCDRIDQVVVITADDTVGDLARAYGARVLPEPEDPGLINAVTHAARTLSAEGVDVMMFLPGDTPLVSVEELEVVLDGFGLKASPEFLIVPASDLGG